MKYNLVSKNLMVTKPLKLYIETKFAKISQFHNKIIHCDVDLSRDVKKKSGPIFRAEINLEIPGHLLRVVEFDYDIRTALDKVRDKIIRQIKKAKGKEESKRRK